MHRSLENAASNPHAVYKIVGGIFFLACCFAASIFTLLTDESLLQGGDGTIHMTWEVVLQPWGFFTGQYPPIEGIAILGAFLIYSAYAYLSLREGMRRDRHHDTIIWILVTFDSIANFQYFHAYAQMPLIYQCMLTGLIYITLVRSGSKGTELLVSGIRELRYAQEEN